MCLDPVVERRVKLQLGPGRGKRRYGRARLHIRHMIFHKIKNLDIFLHDNCRDMRNRTPRTRSLTIGTGNPFFGRTGLPFFSQ